jgi:hypothetical protein
MLAFFRSAPFLAVLLEEKECCRSAQEEFFPGIRPILKNHDPSMRVWGARNIAG